MAEWFEKEWPSIAHDARTAGHSAYDFVQKPGELVYVPPRWWHAVLNCEGGVAVLFNLVVGLEEEIDDEREESESKGVSDKGGLPVA